MFDKDGKLDERSQRILSEQTIPPRYGRSPGMQASAGEYAGWTTEQLKSYEESLYDREVAGEDVWNDRDQVLWELATRVIP